MILNQVVYDLYSPDLKQPTEADFRRASTGMFIFTIPFVESVDVSNAGLSLVSDEARYVTGVALPVDAGREPKT